MSTAVLPDHARSSLRENVCFTFSLPASREHGRPTSLALGQIVAPSAMATFIRWFDEITLGDVARVGGKTASLGEMYRELRPLGVNVPNGFAITADAYWTVLDSAGIRGLLEETLAHLDKRDTAELARRGRMARALVRDASLPVDLWNEVETA